MMLPALLLVPVSVPAPLFASGLTHEPAQHEPAAQDTGDGRGVFTSRTSPVELPLPSEEDAFSFAVFGDRTGGPAVGVEVLRQAVADVNLLAPDLVMTVGDLIQGYDTVEPWMRQMVEFRGIMDQLQMPWFPVAGNHDVYWRGPGRPPQEHEANYETHFGPLWYAFRHKTAWFLVLYTDEADPETGVRDFNRPASQRMSPAQLDWLSQTLERSADAPHVFVFLHHPRWLRGGYGDDWERVHGLLAEAGNVRAVFAGHIHRMRYDGVRDGIEYFTLATVGGHQPGYAERAGYLHHYDIVTVRPDGIAVSALPVGAALDPRAVTGAVSDDAERLARMEPRARATAPFSLARATAADFEVEFENPASTVIEFEATPELPDPRWSVYPDHVHGRLEPGQTRHLTFTLARNPAPIDAAFQLPRLDLSIDLLTEYARFPMPLRGLEFPIEPSDLSAPARSKREHVLTLDGDGDYAEIASAGLELPDGPFTLEGWLAATDLNGRRGFATKTENSEFGLFVGAPGPSFTVHLDGEYVSASLDRQVLELDTWTHVAGVYDGSRVALFVNGVLVAETRAAGRRTTNDLPLIVGGDVNREAAGTSLLPGRIDELRLSKVARYTDTRFTPERRFEPDADTLLLLHMDGNAGPWLYDSSPGAHHARRRGQATVVAN